MQGLHREGTLSKGKSRQPLRTGTADPRDNQARKDRKKVLQSLRTRETWKRSGKGSQNPRQQNMRIRRFQISDDLTATADPSAVTNRRTDIHRGHTYFECGGASADATAFTVVCDSAYFEALPMHLVCGGNVYVMRNAIGLGRAATS